MKVVAIVSLLLFASGAAVERGTHEWPQTESFRILLGVGDSAPESWNGKVRVDGAKLAALEGVRLAGADTVDSAHGTWSLSSHRDTPPGSAVYENGVVVSIADAGQQAKIAIDTAQGTFSFPVHDQPWGARRAYLKGRAVVERVPNTFRITGSDGDQDYPAMTQTGDNVWVAYIEYTHSTPNAPGGDRVRLVHYSKAKRTWAAPEPVSPPGEQCQATAVSMDARGHVWVFWSANREGNTDLYARRWSGSKFEPELRLTTAPGPDLSPAATTDSNGRVWVAWQGWRGDHFRILTSVQDVDRFVPEREVSVSQANNWHPAINAGGGGEIAFAWDTYEKGDYDVWMRRGHFQQDGIALRPPVPVAGSLSFEARPSLVHDSQNWLWVAYEVAAPRWGKEFGPYLTTGTPLFAGRNVVVKSFKDNTPFVTYDSLARVLPGPPSDSAAGPPPALPDPALATNRAPGTVPRLPPLPSNTFPRLTADQAGHIFLAYRATDGWLSPAGTVWTEYLHYFNGARWSGPIAVPHSDGALEARPVMLPVGYSEILLIEPSDNRQSAGSPAGVNSDLYAAEVKIPYRAQTAIMNSTPVALRAPVPQQEYEQAETLAVLREARMDVGGKTFQLVRGDYHRSTDLSPHGGDAGSLSDAWRYFLDAAGLDWAACCDAWNGGREYTWWTEQKFTGFYQMAGRFVSLYGYLSPGRFPSGSRAILMANGGVRPLPADAEPSALGAYLEKSGAIAIPYQTATSHGTDWGHLDPRTEPAVEIYQGARQSYEAPDTPRAISEKDAIGGWDPAGFVAQALAKGLHLGFLAGSGPVSTHQAFANVWVEQPTPQGILDAIRARHVYASTAPVLAQVESAGHLMGDRFPLTGAPTLNVKLSGAEPFSRVEVIRDGKAVYSAEPGVAKVQFEWTDPAPTAGQVSYYYIRGQQAGGNLVWTSPMWIDLR